MQHSKVFFATSYKNNEFGENMFCVIYKSNTKSHFAYICIPNRLGHINA